MLSKPLQVRRDVHNTFDAIIDDNKIDDLLDKQSLFIVSARLTAYLLQKNIKNYWKELDRVIPDICPASVTYFIKLLAISEAIEITTKGVIFLVNTYFQSKIAISMEDELMGTVFQDKNALKHLPDNNIQTMLDNLNEDVWKVSVIGSDLTADSLSHMTNSAFGFGMLNTAPYVIAASALYTIIIKGIPLQYLGNILIEFKISQGKKYQKSAASLNTTCIVLTL